MKKKSINAVIAALIVTAMVTFTIGYDAAESTQLLDCPPDTTFNPEDLLDEVTGLYTVELSDVVTTNQGTDLCLLKSVDFDFGPLVLPNGDTLFINENQAYPFNNGCAFSGDRFFSEQDSTGETINVDTIQYVLCEATLSFCDNELGVRDIIILESENGVNIDTCRVQLTIGEAINTGDGNGDEEMMEGDMTDGGMTDGGMTGVFNPNLACSLDGQSVSVRSTFQDAEINDGAETVILSDTLIEVMSDGAAELISVSDIYDIDFNSQTISFDWNQTGSIAPRTIRQGQFYRFYIDLGSGVNTVTTAERDNILSGGFPSVTLLGENTIVVQWGEGQSIGETFNAVINLTLVGCEDDGSEEGGGQDSMGMMPVDTMMMMDTMMMDTMMMDTMMMDTMMMDTMVMDTMTTMPEPNDPVTDTGFDCTDDLAYTFDIVSLADSTLSTMTVDSPTETADLLTFDLSGNASTIDTITSTDTMLVIDSIFVADSIMVTDTSLVFTTTLELDTMLVRTDTLFTIDTTFTLDSMLLRMDTLITFDTIATGDSTVVFTQVLTGVDSSAVSDTMLVTDSIFALDSMQVFDTMMVVDTMLIIDSTMSVIDTNRIITEVNRIDSIFRIDTTTNVTTTLIIDSMYMPDSMFVRDTMFDVDSMITMIDSMLVIDSVLTSIDTMMINDTMIMTQDVFVGIDTFVGMDTMFVIDTTFMSDTTFTSVNVIDTSQVFTQTFVSVDTNEVITMMTVVDSMFRIDSMLVEGGFRVDTVSTIIDIYNVSSIPQIDTSIVFQSIIDVDTTSTVDSMIVISTIKEPDSVLVIQSIISSIDTSMVPSSMLVFDSIFSADTMTVMDSVFVTDTILQIDTSFVIDSIAMMDTSTLIMDIFDLDTVSFVSDSSFVIDSMLVLDSNMVDSVFVVDSMTLVIDRIFSVDSTFVRTDTSLVINTIFTPDTIFMTDTVSTVVTTGSLQDVLVITQTFERLDSFTAFDTLLVLDTMFTQQSIFREVGEFTRDTTVVIENSVRVVFDLLAMTGDTICGNLIAREIDELNTLNYTLNWNAAAYTYLNCNNGLVGGLGCDIATIDADNGSIRGSFGTTDPVTLSSESVIAQYCFVVTDDAIETPVPFTLAQSYDNAFSRIDTTIMVATSLSLADLGILPVETITINGVDQLVNRCILYSANFDAGAVITGSGEFAFGFVEGCTPDGIVDGVSYAVCRDVIEVCCEEVGAREMTIVTRTQNGIISQCRTDVTINDDNRFCNPLIPFACSDELINISVTDLESAGEGQFTLTLEDVGVTTNAADYCILRTVDFNAGPVTLSTGDVVMVDGETAYTAVNACSQDDQFIESVLNQDGSVNEERTLPYVLCKSTLTLCCADLAFADVTVITMDGNDISETCRSFISVFDPSVAIACSDLTIQCTEDINAAENIPDVTGAGLCEFTAELLFVDNSSEIDTCGLGMVSRTWYIDTNENGTADSIETSCTQIITISNDDAFDPLTIRWPAPRNGSSAAGVRLTCADSTTVTEVAVGSIFLGDAVVCSDPTDGFGTATWCESSCDLLAYSSEIDSVVTETGACVQIFVRHTIIDWCTYTALGRPDDGANDLAASNFEAVEDLRDGCESCDGDGSLAYLRYVPSTISRDGIYSYEQVISLNDDSAPIINAPDTLIVSTDRALDSNGSPLGCSGIDSLTISASDVCGASELSGDLTWRVRVRNFIGFPVFDEDGLSEYNFTGSEFTLSTRSGDEGFAYFVLIDVTDACGNEASKVTTIKFDDITPPTPICLSTAPIVAVTDSMTTTITASDFNLNSIDNCTVPSNLRYSIVPRGVTPINPREVAFSRQRTIEIACENVDTMRAFDIWVWDSSRNGDKCEIDIRIQADCTAPIDTSGMGPDMVDSTGIFITGNVRTPMGESVSGVDFTLINADTTQIEFSKMSQSANDGSYVFNNNALFQDYRLSGSYDDEILNGVTTLDLVLIQKHILGGELLDSPFKVIAADADASNSVSVSDIITFRNVIVGNVDRFPNGNSWIVLPAGQEFADSISPWPLIEAINISNLEGSLEDQDFVAIKIGDVNGTTTAAGLNSAEIRTDDEPVILKVIDRYLTKGETVSINVGTYQADHLLGFQLSLDHEDLIFESSTSSLHWHQSNLNNLDDVTRISWNDSEAINGDQALFTIDFTATQSGLLSDMLRISRNDIAAEAYQGEDLAIHDVRIEFDEVQSEEFVVLQNQPNPFISETVIHFSIPASGMVQTSVFDVTGKVLHNETSNLAAGQHSISLHADDIISTGILYYQIKYDNKIETRKMIILK